MSNSLIDSLVDSEYQLIDTQRFKTEMRTSRIASIPSPKAHQLHPSASHPHPHSKYIEESVELPVSHASIAVQEKASHTNQSQKGFTAEHHKEIEEVIIYEDGYHKRSGFFNAFINVKNETTQQVDQPSHKKSRFNLDKPDVITPLDSQISKQSNQMVQMYEKLNSERKRYQEVGYFKSKQRSIEEMELDELFQKYRQDAVHPRVHVQQEQVQPIPSPTEKSSGYKQNRYFQHSNTGSKVSQHQKHQHETTKYVSLKHSTKGSKQHLLEQQQSHSKDNLSIQCLLCKMSKLNLKSSKDNQPSPKYPAQITQQNLKFKDLQTFAQSRVMRVNASPNKTNKQRYLSSEEKKDYNRKNSIQPDQTWMEQGKLKKHYLRQLQARKQQQQQSPKNHKSPQKQSLTLQSLGNSIQRNLLNGSGQKCRTPRKKIFSGIQAASSKPFIKIQTELKTGSSRMQQTKVSGYDRSLSSSKPTQSHKKIFTTIKEKVSPIIKYTSTTITRQLNFNSLRQGLVNSRVKIFRSKEKQKEASPTKKKSLIPGLRLLQMSAQVRKWYEDNRKEVVFQAERICSYDLINRYMTQQQVSSRLFNLVNTMVEPKRWVLLMVDQVYARLKDRYLPE